MHIVPPATPSPHNTPANANISAGKEEKNKARTTRTPAAPTPAYATVPTS